MKNVMVIAVLFLSSVSMLFSQDYAAVSNTYSESYVAPNTDDKKTISPEKTDSPIFINGSDFQSELTGLRLMPSPAKERVELLINSIMEKTYQVELYDQLGNKLQRYDISANSPTEIQVEQYIAGGYYFLIYIPDGTIKKKFRIVD